MEGNWTLAVDLSLLSVFLIVATAIKRKIRFFQKYLIPNSIIAGFIGLICGPELLNIVDVNPDRMGNIVYHLMAIGFIALALKDRQRIKNRTVANTGFFIIANYIIQGIIGFAITLALAFTIFPELFPAFGLLLPLGFGQGPGQAYSMGRQWEEIGFLYGGNMGLTVAAMGFIWACICGIPFINWLMKKKKKEEEEKEKGKGSEKESADQSASNLEMVIETDSPDDIPLSESIDRISIQVALIGVVYLATYIFIKIISGACESMGDFGKTFGQLLWGFSFIIGSMFAILAKIIIGILKKKNLMSRNYTNNFLMQRIAGFSFDFMITASICGISIFVVREYMIPLLLITTAGGLITVFFDYHIGKMIYKKWFYENVAGMYGMMTGTISTGLALIREIDPDFKSDAPKNLVLGSGAGLVAGLPLMLLLNVPIVGYKTGQPVMYFYTFLGLILYLVVLLVVIYANTRPGKPEKR